MTNIKFDLDMLARHAWAAYDQCSADQGVDFESFNKEEKGCWKAVAERVRELVLWDIKNLINKMELDR